MPLACNEGDPIAEGAISLVPLTEHAHAAPPSQRLWLLHEGCDALEQPPGGAAVEDAVVETEGEVGFHDEKTQCD